MTLFYDDGIMVKPGPGGVKAGKPDRGEGFPQVPRSGLGSVAVLDARGGDQHRQQQPDGVHGDVPLAAVAAPRGALLYPPRSGEGMEVT